MIVDVNIPMRTVSGANERENPFVRAKRVKRERSETALFLQAGCDLRALRAMNVRRVLFVRSSSGELDTDNLAMSMKHVRDEVAKQLGVSDAPSGGVDWRYDQAKCARGEHGVRVTIETEEKERVM